MWRPRPSGGLSGQEKKKEERGESLIYKSIDLNIMGNDTQIGAGQHAHTTGE